MKPLSIACLALFGALTVASGKAFADDPTGGAIPNSGDKPPVQVFSFAGSIIGNGGDPFGSEFSRVIRVDVFETLQKAFAMNKVPDSSPLAPLKTEMKRFGELLAEQTRVYAVQEVHDVYGQRVLARVVATRRLVFAQPGAPTITEDGPESLVGAEPIVVKDVLVRSEALAQGRLSLEVENENRLFSMEIIPEADGLSYVRTGADVVTPEGYVLAPGQRFWAKCASTFDPQEIKNLKPNAAAAPVRVDLLCGVNRIEGTVVTIRGSFFIDTAAPMVNNSFKGHGEISLHPAIQTHIIQVDKGLFEENLDKQPTLLRRNVFHEYLHLLGIDDQGYKVSSHIDALIDLMKTATPAFPYVGAVVMIPVGTEIVQKSGNDYVVEQGALPKTGRAMKGKVESVFNVVVHNPVVMYLDIDGEKVPWNAIGDVPYKIVQVNVERMPGLWDMYYFRSNDLQHVPAEQ